MSDEIYLDLKVKVAAVSLFTDPQRVVNFIDSPNTVGVYPDSVGFNAVPSKISIHGVTIKSAEITSGSYSALAALGNEHAIEVTEQQISDLNIYLQELRDQNP